MAVTPMMQQYLEIKDRYRDYILFYRLGDFYDIWTHRVPHPELSEGVPQVSLQLSRRKSCWDDTSSAEDANATKLLSRLACFFCLHVVYRHLC